MQASRTQETIDALWDFDDPSTTERRFRDALGQAAPDERLEFMTQIARAQALQRQFEDANRTLDEVEAHLHRHAHDANYAPAVVRYLLERGRTLNSAGDVDESRKLFRQAWDLACRARLDALAVDAAHMVAIVSRGTLAMEWNLRALARAESSTVPRARQWRGSLHNNIGWTLHDQGKFDAALQHFEKALACRIEQNKAGDIRVAKWCVARCWRSLNRLEEALHQQRALLDAHNASGNSPDGFVHEELGECLLALGRPSEAQPHFAQAHRLLAGDAWFAGQHPDRLQRMAQLGRAEHGHG